MQIRIEFPARECLQTSEKLAQEFKAVAELLQGSESISCRAVPKPSHRAFPGHESIVLIFQFASSVGAGVVANWIYDKMRNKNADVVIGSKTVSAEDPSALAEVINEETSKSNK